MVKAPLSVGATLSRLLPVLFVAASQWPACAATSAPQQQQPVRIDAVLAEEKLGTSPIAFAADGRALAFTWLRPKGSQLTNNFLHEETRSDIWIQEAPGHLARNLTQGWKDQSGWWSPKWSPDGQRLALVSSRGGVITLWVWDRAQNRMAQVSVDAMDYSEQAATLGTPAVLNSFRWVDNNRLLCAMLPAGQVSSPLNAYGLGVEAAKAAWAKAARGELTVNTVDSLEFKFPQRRLILIDVTTGASRQIATMALEDSLTPFIKGTDTSVFWESPNGKAVAYIAAPGVYEYPAMYRRAMGFPSPVELRDLDGRPVPLAKSLPRNILTATLRWSPDGRELAFFAHGDVRMHPVYLYGEGVSEVQHESVASVENPARLWRVNIDSGAVDDWATGEIDMDLDLMSALNTSIVMRNLAPPPFSWTASGELLFHARRKTANNASPEWLILQRDGRTHPALAPPTDRPPDLKVPDPKASLKAYSSHSKSAVYYANTRNGTFLWRVDAAGGKDELMAANTWRAGAPLGKRRNVEYVSIEGEKLTGRLALPVDYVPARRYPLYVSVYPGTPSVADFESSEVPGDGPSIVGAMGYAHLYPATPEAWGKEGPTLAGLANGVLPAIEKVIEEGVADPDRLFVYGCSDGGYQVQALLTQTRRFTAAVADCGISDFTNVGSFVEDIRYRYTDNPFDHYAGYAFGAAYATGNLPFWLDGRLPRNVPLNYVDRVRTPLMIIKNNVDGAQTNQEAFFFALLMQRKPAQLVRYWGDGHGQHIPANYRDAWQRIFAWLDRWGDIARDANGKIVFDAGRAQSRRGAPALAPADYLKFDLFAPASLYKDL